MVRYGQSSQRVLHSGSCYQESTPRSNLDEVDTDRALSMKWRSMWPKGTGQKSVQTSISTVFNMTKRSSCYSLPVPAWQHYLESRSHRYPVELLGISEVSATRGTEQLPTTCLMIDKNTEQSSEWEVRDASLLLQAENVMRPGMAGSIPGEISSSCLSIANFT
nr:hypothetical protein CFP56_55008 [Quercus suber]